jgi:hypothetical protein
MKFSYKKCTSIKLQSKPTLNLEKVAAAAELINTAKSHLSYLVRCNS